MSDGGGSDDLSSFCSSLSTVKRRLKAVGAGWQCWMWNGPMRKETGAE